MATLQSSARNAAVSAVAALLDGGTLRFRSSGGDTLCDVDLQATAFGAASDGVVTAVGGDDANPISPENPLTGSGESAASDGATIANCQALNSEGGVVMSLTVGTSGSGADVILTSLTIAHEQELSVTGCSLTMPAS